ncbi:MAG: sigma-70 family RNA polymerase sigma factor [Sphingobacteriales bacterium]|nr:sigma-70 family RNA polymerase sigma factor [Sphingobacteriales bacterium]
MHIALKLTDEQHLLTACLHHDRVAQKRLYEVFYGKMMGVCLRYAGNREEAEDVLSEGFVKVFNNLHRYEPTYSLESWIRRIMINNAIDTYRRNKKYQYDVELEQAYMSPEQENIHANLSAEDILKLVQKLSPAYRAVFNLYAIEGYNHREIGELLGISEGASKSNLSKARARLQTMLRELEI